MSISTLILGQSGTGKTTSLRNLDPAHTLLIQAIPKPLPFRNDWKLVKDSGNILVTDNSAQIVAAMKKTSRNIIVIDDFQYTMSNEFMRRVLDNEVGNSAFAKYNEIARSAWDILMCAASLPANKRVYILSHTQEDEAGHIKIKTIGKLLDEKITIEGLVSIVLRTQVINGNYLFSTKNNGNDTTKSPIDMFDDEHVENDLAQVDEAIFSYYALKEENAN
jgi:AAA domain